MAALLRRGSFTSSLVFCLVLALASSARAALFQQGEAGVGLTWQANAAGTAAPVTLSGSSVTMVFRAANASSVQTRSCPVQSDGNSCIYVTTASDFPVAGPTVYYVQFIATYGNGIVRKSPTMEILVGRSLQ